MGLIRGIASYVVAYLLFFVPIFLTAYGISKVTNRERTRTNDIALASLWLLMIAIVIRAVIV